MFRQFLILFSFCFAPLSIYAQTGKYAVPVKWEKYRVGDNDVAVLLPKLPVSMRRGDWCYNLETKEYAVYNDQTIYGLTINLKTKEKAPDYCSSKRQFSEKYFPERIAELKTELSEYTESNFKQNDLNVYELAGKNKTYWLINDYENKRWFEMWVMGANKDKAEVKNFIKSIEISRNVQGIEIGSGAERTFGDEIIKSVEKKTEEPSPIVIGFKPAPRYTDAARQANVQGTVTLRVTFYTNGAIGSISPATTLPYGLTEQAILAAQRIVFIPPKRNGIPYNVSKAISYNFTIY